MKPWERAVLQDGEGDPVAVQQVAPLHEKPWERAARDRVTQQQAVQPVVAPPPAVVPRPAQPGPAGVAPTGQPSILGPLLERMTGVDPTRQPDVFPKVMTPSERIKSIPPLKDVPEWRNAPDPTLWQQFRDLIPGNSASAHNEWVARRWSKETGLPVEAFYAGVGGHRPMFNPEGQPTVGALMEAGKAVGREIPDVPPGVMNYVGRAWRGGEMGPQDKGLVDWAISATASKEKPGGDRNLDAFRGLGPSFGASLATMIASITAGAAGGSVTTPAGGVAAGMAAAGTVAYRASKDEFLGGIRKRLNDEAQKLYGRPLNAAEWGQAVKEFEDEAQRYGLWEAIPEAASNAIFLKAFRGPLAGMKPARLAQVENKAVEMFEKLAPKMGAAGAEQATETVTALGQRREELRAGLSREEMTIADAFRKQFVQTLLTTGGMAMGMKGAGLAHRFYTDHVEPRVAPGSALAKAIEADLMYVGFSPESIKQAAARRLDPDNAQLKVVGGPWADPAKINAAPGAATVQATTPPPPIAPPPIAPPPIAPPPVAPAPIAPPPIAPPPIAPPPVAPAPVAPPPIAPPPVAPAPVAPAPVAPAPVDPITTMQTRADPVMTPIDPSAQSARATTQTAPANLASDPVAGPIAPSDVDTTGIDPWVLERLKYIERMANLAEFKIGGERTTLENLIHTYKKMVGKNPGTEKELLASTEKRVVKAAKDAVIGKVSSLYVEQFDKYPTADAQLIGAIKAGVLDISKQPYAADAYELLKIDPAKIQQTERKTDPDDAVAQQLRRLEAGVFSQPGHVVGTGREGGEVAKAANERAEQAYAQAVKLFLEGPLTTPVPGKKDSKLDGLFWTSVNDVNVRPIEKKINSAKPANTFEDQTKALYVIAPKNDVRYYLNGVLVDRANNRLVATDGSRLVIISEPNLAGAPAAPADRNVLGRDGQWIKGQFPDIDRVMPTSHNTGTYRFNAAELGDKARGMVKAWRYGGSRFDATMPIQLDDITAPFNASYIADMTDLFRRMGYDTFDMSFVKGRTSPEGSMIYATSPDGRVRQVVMGLREGVEANPFRAVVGQERAGAAPAPAPAPAPTGKKPRAAKESDAQFEQRPLAEPKESSDGPATNRQGRPAPGAGTDAAGLDRGSQSGAGQRLAAGHQEGSGSNAQEARAESTDTQGGVVKEPDSRYTDPYEHAETRPGTTEAQREAGRAALDDLRGRFGFYSLQQRGGDARGGAVSVLGLRLIENFSAGKPNVLVGQRVESAQDLAALAQVYRDPRFETFRVVYVDSNNQVVGETGYTSRLPGVVHVPGYIATHIEQNVQRFGATGFYLMHNHPAGSAKPSSADVALTVKIARDVPGFLGHTIIDHNEYAIIDRHGGSQITQDKALGGVDFHGTPAIPHKLLGRSLLDARDVAALARELQTPQGHATLILTSGENARVQLIVDVPMDLLTDTSPQGILKGKALIRRMARDSGGGSYRFIVLPSGVDMGALSAWAREGVFTDIVSASGISYRATTKDFVRDDFIGNGHPMSVREDSGSKYDSINTFAEGPGANVTYANPDTRGTRIDDFVRRVSFTNRESFFRAAFRDAGIDPAVANNLPIERQFNILARHLEKTFGLKFVDKTPRASNRKSVDELLDLSRNMQFMMAALELPAKTMGLEGSLGIVSMEKQKFFGVYYPSGSRGFGSSFIGLPSRTNSFAHEWGHALDFWLMDKIGGSQGGGLSGVIRHGGMSETPSSSERAFVDLVNALFFDQAQMAAKIMDLERKIATTQSDSARGKLQAQLDAIRAGASKDRGGRSEFYQGGMKLGNPGYYLKPTEMIARSFEVFISHKVESLGGTTEAITKSLSAYGNEAVAYMQQAYPQQTERDTINLAWENLIDALRAEAILGRPGDQISSVPGNLDIIDPREMVRLSPETRSFWRREVDAWNAFRAEHRRNKQRPKNPQTVLQHYQNAMTAVLWSERGSLLTMMARYPQSQAIGEVVRKLTTDPGTSNLGNRLTLEEATDRQVKRFSMKVGEIVRRYGLDKLDDAQMEALRRLLVSQPDGNATPALVEAADKIRNLFNEAWYYGDNAGLKMGYAINAYLPRMMNMARVDTDPNGFISAASRVYEVKFDSQYGHYDTDPDALVGLLARGQKILKLQNKGRLPHRAEGMTAEGIEAVKAAIAQFKAAEAKAKAAAAEQNDPDAAKAKAEEEMAKAIELAGDAYDFIRAADSQINAARWLVEINTGGNIAQIPGASPDADFMKGRVLPPEADVLLKGYLEGDVIALMMDYIPKLVRRAEYEKRFGGERLSDLKRKMEAEGVSRQDIEIIEGIVAKLSGAVYDNSMGVAAKAVQTVQAFGIMSMLGRAVFSAIAEPLGAAVHTRHVLDAFRGMSATLTSFLPTATARERAELAAAIGVIGNPYMDQMLSNREGGYFQDDPNMSHRMAKYYMLTLQHQWLSHTGMGAMTVSQRFILERIKTLMDNKLTPAERDRALRDLKELGLQPEDIKPLEQWMSDTNKDGESILSGRKVTVDELDSDMGEVYSGMVYRMTGKIILNPKPTDTSAFSKTTLGRAVMSIMSFAYAFQRQYLIASYKKIQEEYRASGSLSETARVAGGVALGISSLVAGQMLISALREMLFNPDRWEEMEKKGELGEYLLKLGVSRAGLTGAWDPIYNAYHGVRYQRDVATTLVGAVPGYFFQALQRILTPFVRNSEKTNTAEYNAAVGAYELVATPLMAWGLTTLPVSPLTTTLGFAAYATATSPKGKQTAAEIVAGPKDKGQGSNPQREQIYY